jgi:sugar lactone lactonase YvrE
VRARSLACVAALLVFCASVAAFSQPLTVTTFAGHNGGAVDGPVGTALFALPKDFAKDDQGNLYVADSGNHTIRKISAAGVVTTLAGLADNPGTANGTGNKARFYYPHGVATDSSGNVYVTSASPTVRKITPEGVVTTLAGNPSFSGSADGTGANARFFQVSGIATDGDGNVYVTDDNHLVRKITPEGVVTTVAGLAGVQGTTNGNGAAARFNYPSGIDVDSSGNLYVADTNNHAIRKITPEGDVTTFAGVAGSGGAADGNGAAARFFTPDGLTLDDSGNLYVSEPGVYTIRKITQDADVTTLAGVHLSSGYVDANGSAARFLYPAGLIVKSGILHVADSNMIRTITVDGTVSTYAGRFGGPGFEDGTGNAARFTSPEGVAVDGDGNVFVADTFNCTIRKISPAGEVITFAGKPRYFGTSDGVGDAVRFNRPQGLGVDGDGFVYVADTDNNTIRKISPSGTVSTFAGLALSAGSADGTATARFNKPRGVAVGSDGTVYVADYFNHTIRKITAAGVVSTLAGSPLNPGSADGNGSVARFNYPGGVAVDADGNVYVADSGNQTIRKITPAGDVTTFAGTAAFYGSSDGQGSAARFYSPRSIAVDAGGNLYVADAMTAIIRKITPGGLVTTVAGVAGKLGLTDGTGSAARFTGPAGIAVGSDNRVYIADIWQVIRLGVPALPDAATIDARGGPLSVPRQLDTAPQTATEWTWSIIRRPAGSSNELSATSIRNPTFVPDALGLFTFQLVATAASVPSITTVDLSVPVAFGPPENLSATAIATWKVALSWTAVSGATNYEIYRSYGGGPFAFENLTASTTYTDFNAVPNTTFLYKVRAVDIDGPSPFSQVAAATTTMFTDHPLSAGTRIKAAHILELRTAVNAMRAAAGLSSATFATTVATGAKIQAAAIDELRAAIDPARAALGLPAMTYVDATLTPQSTAVKATHVMQLRDAVE